MSKVLGTEEILDKAKEEEKQYDWLKPADYYREALKAVARAGQYPSTFSNPESPTRPAPVVRSP